MDKDEITAEAQRLGTYPDLDHSGSGLLHAVHAAASGDASAQAHEVERAEAALPIDEMVEQAVAAAAVEEFDFP